MATLAAEREEVRRAGPGSGGLTRESESASPTNAVSGVRKSCESAERIELRKRSD